MDVYTKITPSPWLGLKIPYHIWSARDFDYFFCVAFDGSSTLEEPSNDIDSGKIKYNFCFRFYCLSNNLHLATSGVENDRNTTISGLLSNVRSAFIVYEVNGYCDQHYFYLDEA